MVDAAPARQQHVAVGASSSAAACPPAVSSERGGSAPAPAVSPERGGAAPAPPDDAAAGAGAPIAVSAAQDAAIRLAVEEGKSILLTGAAGTGKSHVVREIKRRLEAAGRRVALCATTGVAAVAVGGSTLHALLRLPAEVSAGTLARLERAAPFSPALEPARAMHCLVIDEASMLSPALMAAADAVLRAARKRPREPFGGAQLVLVGDFFQLPPVGGQGAAARERDDDEPDGGGGGGGRGPPRSFFKRASLTRP